MIGKYDGRPYFVKEYPIANVRSFAMAEPGCATASAPASTSVSSPETAGEVKDDSKEILRIAIIGAGTIGLSFAALHLAHPANRLGKRRVQVSIYDPRPDLKEYIEATLPGPLHILCLCSLAVFIKFLLRLCTSIDIVDQDISVVSRPLQRRTGNSIIKSTMTKTI